MENDNAPASDAIACLNECNYLSTCAYWDYGGNFCRLRSNDGGGKVVANGYSYGPKNCRYSKKESTTN